MYLKALEIQGFKSFPEKTRITFERPVTCIVGPNGSGKSNISDAILWVTGEQSSRNLRGGKMEDVIFGGTQKRSQVGFAEVSLILNNSAKIFDVDSSEVMITRRYYRSGESEYYINKRTVRLRDVNELLMDTGMGREGYSIIGQGKIDSILSARSTDRRDIFEEAAGISKFRHRKEESERRLERTDENLLRVNDKIAELEMQVEPLREQAETAKKYLLLRDELRGAEITVWLDSLDTLGKETEKLKADYDSVKLQLNQLHESLEAAYRESESFAAKMRGKDVEAESVREKISGCEERLSDTESASAVLEANLKNNIEQVRRIKEELSEQEDRDGGIKSQIDERRTRIDKIDGENSALSLEIEGIREKIAALTRSAGEAAQELSELMQRESETSALESELKSKLSALSSSAQELEDRENSVTGDIASALERLEKVREDAETCRLELDKAIEEKVSENNIISGYALRVSGKREKLKSVEDKKVKINMEQGALKSRINLLTEMEKDFQGYSRAVKAIMQESDRGILKNIHGTVAGLITAEDKYALAVETALGGSMQSIVVSSEEDGKAAINFLKRRDIGRATFLPVSTVRGNVLSEKGLAGETGFEGLAIDVVAFDKQYSGIYASLLGRTAVVASMDDAIRISRKYSNRFRIVTLDGQVMNVGGSMTGGSNAKNAGILSRANELKKLRQQQEILSEAAGKTEREYEESQRELNKLEYELEVSRSQMRRLEDSIIQLESEQKHLEIMRSDMETSVMQLKEERMELSGRIKNVDAEITGCRKSIADAGQALAKVRIRVKELTEGQESFNTEKERLNDALGQMRAEKASLEAERSALNKAVTELTALREDLTGGRLRQLESIKGLETENKEIQADIYGKKREIEELNDKISKYRDRIREITSEKMSLEAERTRHDRETQEKNKNILDLERECSRLEQKRLASELEEKQIIDRLWDTYELSRSDAALCRRETEDMQALKKRIGELKREISRLGTPNIGAIDEFTRVNTRYEFLTGQRDDIEKAKKELLDIIEDITKEMREIFAREFKIINESFKETFLELFGGGKASLELEDEENILTCGIEIHVQPPGKSLKTLTLLSGGEKAFVAIAIYFAILKVRPTPFVVMDEIEAALDEANVLRFASSMRKMSDKTQMIVITHRRGTMEEADMLYGVTMQEQGVSRVLSIDLEEAEKTIEKKQL